MLFCTHFSQISDDLILKNGDVQRNSYRAGWTPWECDHLSEWSRWLNGWCYTSWPRPKTCFFFFGPRVLRGWTSTIKTCVERVHICSCCFTFFVGYATKKHLTQNRPIQARGTYSLKKHVFFGAPKLFPKPSSSVAQQRVFWGPRAKL